MVLRQGRLEGIRQFPAKGSPKPGGQVGYGAVNDQEVVLFEEREYRFFPLFVQAGKYLRPRDHRNGCLQWVQGEEETGRLFGTVEMVYQYNGIEQPVHRHDCHSDRSFLWYLKPSPRLQSPRVRWTATR